MMTIQTTRDPAARERSLPATYDPDGELTAGHIPAEDFLAGEVIDVRLLPEFAAGHIAGSRLIPLPSLAAACTAWARDTSITLVCKAGTRAEQARRQLDALGFTALHVLPGGIDQWRAEGRPLVTTRSKPWSLERQVRIVAGTLVLLTLTLSLLVSHYFIFATAFVGAGLVFAGVSDICMMASLLALLQWNRPSKSSPGNSLA